MANEPQTGAWKGHREDFFDQWVKGAQGENKIEFLNEGTESTNQQGKKVINFEVELNGLKGNFTAPSSFLQLIGALDVITGRLMTFVRTGTGLETKYTNIVLLPEGSEWKAEEPVAKPKAEPKGLAKAAPAV